MNWWIETLTSHFQSDVIEPALRKVLGKIGEAGGSADEIAENATSGEDGRDDLGGAGHARSRSSKSARPSPASTILSPVVPSPSHVSSPTPVSTNPPLDFASLTTIHSLFLSTLYSGLLLDSEELSGQVKEMLTTCDEFAARLGRWGGDILPGLLDNSGDERNAQREFILSKLV